MAAISVKLYPDTIGHIGPIAITNTMFTAFTVSAVMIVFALILRKKLSVNPGRLQVLFEMMVNMILDKMKMAFGSEKRARKYFPFIFTIFLYLVFSNYFMLIPFLDTIRIDGSALFNTPTAHYSQTIALALFTLGGSHLIAFLHSPLRHIGAFIKLGPLFKARSVSEIGMAFIDIFLGFLDLVGEFAKLISMSTRLFGNLLAGGVIIGIISSLSFFTQFGAPLPFIVLGLLGGFVQAFVFSMLGLLFMASLNLTVIPLKAEEEDLSPQTN